MKHILIILFSFVSIISFSQKVVIADQWAGKIKIDCDDINDCVEFPDEYELSCDELNQFSDCINELVDHPDFIDTNTTYTFFAECDDSGIHFEFASQNPDINFVWDDIIDLSCHIEVVMNNTIEDLQDQIDDFVDTDTQLSEIQVDAFVDNNGYLTNCADCDATNEIQTLTTTPVTIYQEQYSGGSNSKLGASIWTRNTTVTQTAEGLFTVVFNAPHADGSDYHISYEGIEDANRDNPKITTVEGTKTANGFDVMITVDDNGTGADVYEDNAWSFGVDAPIQVLQTVTISN